MASLTGTPISTRALPLLRALPSSGSSPTLATGTAMRPWLVPGMPGLPWIMSLGCRFSMTLSPFPGLAHARGDVQVAEVGRLHHLVPERADRVDTHADLVDELHRVG